MKEYFYDVELIWKSEQEGLLNSHGMPSIEAVAPKESPREKKIKWTPEHLLAASVSSSFMATFIGVAENSNLQVYSYKSQCFLKLEKVNGKFVTSEILLRPIICIETELSHPTAYKCLEDAKRSCPIKNALRISVEVHPHFEFLIKEDKVKI